MSSKEFTAPVSTPGLLSTTDILAGVTELNIVEVPIKAPPQRRLVLYCRMCTGCLRHLTRRERCSHRRRPSAVRVALS